MKYLKEDAAIEACFGIMVDEAYKGSYAAPREAFRKVLHTLLDAQKERIAKAVEGKRKIPNPYKDIDGATKIDLNAYNRGITDVLAIINGTE